MSFWWEIDGGYSNNFDCLDRAESELQQALKDDSESADAQKVLNNVKEVKSRDGILVSLRLKDDVELQENSGQYISIPKMNEFLFPILETISLQLLAYHIADRRGCDVDQPRNLAKSVTVE